MDIHNGYRTGYKRKAPSNQTKYGERTEDYYLYKTAEGRRKAAGYTRGYFPELKKRKTFTPGKDRTSGYYGKFGAAGEWKFLDTNMNNSSIASAGVITATIVAIPQGTTESERIGRKCTIRSIGFRYSLRLLEVDAAATPGNKDATRIIIYVDKQCNGATAAVLDILETATEHSFRNLANNQRFTFLMDEIVGMEYTTLASDGAGLVSSAGTNKEYSWYKKCLIPLEFNSTTGAIGEIRSNNIGVLLISQGGTPEIISQFRVRYSDN